MQIISQKRWLRLFKKRTRFPPKPKGWGFHREYFMINNHPLIGKTLADDYQVVSFLGKGGMGMVFVGEQLSLNRKVVIKLLPTLDLSSEEAYRFETEIAAMATLCHPNIVTIYHRGKFGDPPTLYYVMEFLEGGSLKDYLKEYGKLPISTSIRLIRQVAEGLSYAHEQGCVHRDIKPDNLLFNRNFRILKIADFGIAKQTSGSSNITSSQNMVGTFLYAAPEQMNWSKDEDSKENIVIDGRADQYSLGMVFYEMLSGRLPYQVRNFFEMVKALESAPVPLSTAVGHAMPNSVEWLINTMISKDRTHRFANDEELLEAITDVEMEQASSSTTRVFSIKSDEMIQVPPPQFKSFESAHFKPPASSQNEKMFIQNLKTMDCSPQQMLATELKKRHAIMAGTCLGIIFLLIMLWIIFKPSSEVSHIFVKFAAGYDILPPKNYAKLQVFILDKKTNQNIELPQTVPIGQYQLTVVLPGYFCTEHGKELNITGKNSGNDFRLDLHLLAIPRKISPQILNEITNQNITPLIFKIGDKDIILEQELLPGKYPIYARFQKYYDIQTEVEIPLGAGIFQYTAPLRPLKEITSVFQSIKYPNDSKILLKIIVDGQQLASEHYNYQEKDWLFISIRVPDNSKKILIFWGYYYEELQIDHLNNVHNFSKIDASQLIQHLQSCKKNQEQLQQMFDFLWKNDQKKLQNLSSSHQRQIYDWLVQNTKAEESKTYQAIQNPIWLLRQTLNSEESRERSAIIDSLSKYPTLNSKERVETLTNLLKQFPDGGYKDYLKNLLEYDSVLWDYENEFRNSVQDYVLSPSERRKLLTLRRKIKSEDIQKIHERIEAYLKEIKCDRSLKEMLSE